MRKILHFDLDAFFCAVEAILNPDLRGLAFVVAGRAEARGVVSSASYEARKFGVHSAMPTAVAQRLCRDLVVVPGRHREYGEHSQRVMALVRASAPVVEPISIDEAFLDVSDDPRLGGEIARDLQSQIRVRFSLPSSWGVATSKLVAKIATEVGKPEGLVVVPAGEEAAFLAPLPLRYLMGVGPKTHERLEKEGIHRIGDLADMAPSRLEALLGPHGPDLILRAMGIDDRPVVESRRRVSLSSERTFVQDVSSAARLRRELISLSEEVGGRLRAEALAGRTVRLKVRWPDFRTVTRQVQLGQPTDQDREIFDAAWRLFVHVWRPGRAVRLLGVAASDLASPLRQLDLFDHAWKQDARLLQAIDAIRTKYGQRALTRAAALMQTGARRDEDST